MASTASTSAVLDLSTQVEEQRPQAGPLPSKRGEIGYREGEHDMERGVDETDGRSVMALPARHPADRDGANVEADADVPLTPVTLDAAHTAVSSTQEVPQDTSSTHSTGKRSIISFLRPQNVPTFGGLRLTTLLLFFFQLSLIGGTIAGWAIAIIHLNKSAATSNTQNGGGLQGASSIIFIHVVFGIAALGQVIFIERRLFRLRAERYSYIHPGEMLPTSHRRNSASMGFAPWHRPPLPTYAAALSQSGVGTGDVEDNAIAVPPPPAYGQSRGSRLLLQGYLRESLRAQRPVSEHSQMSQRDERPLSYASQDNQWEEVQDADRAMKLEETLSRLEEGDVPSTSQARR